MTLMTFNDMANCIMHVVNVVVTACMYASVWHNAGGANVGGGGEPSNDATRDEQVGALVALSLCRGALGLAC